MAHAPRALPSREEELHLHRRLLDGELDAPADLAAQYLGSLIVWLKERNDRSIRDEWLVEAAEDTLISLMKNPRSFVPGKNPATRPLFAYLCMCARGDLKNVLAREKRQLKGQIPLEFVEQSPGGGKHLEMHDDPSLAVQYAEELTRGDKTIVTPAQDGLSDGEKQAMDLMLQGERKTAAFAKVLQVEHLPDEEQRRVVYRTKNKLKKRIERGRGSDGQES